MGVPTKKMTKTKSRMRQAGKALSKIKLVKCKRCNASKKPHTVCMQCGTYKGRNVLTKDIAKLSKKINKKSK